VYSGERPHESRTQSVQFSKECNILSICDATKRAKRFEQQLLEEMQVAEEAYRAASAEHKKIRTEFRNMLNYPDGARAVHEAAKRERVALENYARALRAFTDLTLRGRRPIPPGDPKS
jgi:hypothetical protein